MMKINEKDSKLKTFLFLLIRAVVVAQLVEQSIPTPEVRGFNLVIGKLYITYVSSVLKRRNKEKDVGNCPFLKGFYNF